MSKLDLTKEDLEKIYRNHSTVEIGRMYGVCAEIVRRRLHEFGIKTRKRGGRRQFDPPAKELERLYQKHSMREIAEKFGVGETVVFKRLTEHGITLRGYEKGGHRLKPGRTFSPEARQNMSKSKRGRWTGDKNPNWKGGVHYKNIRLRASAEYKQWRYEALDLKGFKCEQCGIAQHSVCECCGTKIRLHVHHIKSFSRYPTLRFDPKNSEVLCPKCHHSRHHGKTG